MEMKAPPYHNTVAPSTQFIVAKKQVNYVLIFSDIIAVVTIIVMAVAVGTDYWFEHPDKKRNVGMWRKCDNGVCISIKARNEGDDMASVYILRGLSLAAVGASVLSVVLISLALCHVSPKCCAAWAGVLLIVASLLIAALICVFLLIFVLVTAFVGGTAYLLIGSIIGYSFILACVAVGLAFVAGVLAYVGACVDRSEHTAGVIIAP